MHGSVLRPGEPAYDAARRIFNGMIDKRPRVIVQALGAGDVIEAVRFARDNDLPVAVRGGGHNVAGHALCEDGMLIDLSRLRSVLAEIPFGLHSYWKGHSFARCPRPQSTR